jgi:hypothetical protein
LVCPMRVLHSLPLAKSHTFKVWSADPEIAIRPSGANATVLIAQYAPSGF